jgi:hypothetical protein
MCQLVKRGRRGRWRDWAEEKEGNRVGRGERRGRERTRTNRLEDNLNDLDRSRVLVLERNSDEGLEEGEVACTWGKGLARGRRRSRRKREEGDVPQGSSWMKERRE